MEWIFVYHNGQLFTYFIKKYYYKITHTHAQIKNYKQYQDDTTMLQNVSPKDNFSCQNHENAK
jgi:hypothetical protein